MSQIMQTELTERLLVMAAALINDIRAKQNQEEKNWFEGFETWEHDGYEDGQNKESIAIEWPNLAISCDNLNQALKAIYENRQNMLQAEINRLELEVVQAIKQDRAPE